MIPHPAVLFAAVVLLGGCTTPATTQPVDTTPTDTVTVAPPPEPTIAVIVTPAATSTSAVRVDPPEPPPDPCTLEQHVNGIAYRELDPTPTTEAYRIVAACLGWTVATINFYSDGVNLDILPKESSNCPLIRGGQAAAPDCTPSGPLTYDDVGLFQITHGTRIGSGLCEHWGYCTADDIVQSPWHSMRSGLLLIMIDGRRPWTWDTNACQYHSVVCSTWPRHFEMLP